MAAHQSTLAIGDHCDEYSYETRPRYDGAIAPQAGARRYPAKDYPASAPEGGRHGVEDALSRRHSSRDFAPKELPWPLLSNLLWAAYGINRVDKGRTAPSAINSQEIDIYVALPSGAYLYDATANVLQLVAASDVDM